MTRRPPRDWERLFPPLILAGAGLLVWWPSTGFFGLAASTIGAACGGWWGLRLAPSRLRTWAAPVVSIFGMAVGWVVIEKLGGLPIPVGEFWPEAGATLRDALQVGLLSGGTAFSVTFLGGRFRFLRILPTCAFLLAAALLLAPHRHGAINRPLLISDLAWIRGWHPALVLVLIGISVALLAAAALISTSTARRIGLSTAGAVLLAILVALLAPSVGLFHFKNQDPLGLAGNPNRDLGLPRSRPATGGKGDHDPLGLMPRPQESTRPGGGSSAPEPLPFRDDYSSSQQPVPVAVVVLHDDIAPGTGMLYFRQLAFSAWNGRRLVQSFVPGVDDDLFRQFPTESETRQLPAGAGRFKQLVPTSVGLVRDHFQPLVLADGFLVESAENPDPALFRRTYLARSMVLTAQLKQLVGQRPGNPEWPDAVRTQYLETPSDPRYRELAGQILDRIPTEHRSDPIFRAVAIALWLEKNTRYSLRSNHSQTTDPTASYLFGNRIGYCVHLAHATVLLARSLGVPARVAAGYAFSNQDRGNGSSVMLLSSDAHAWAEIYLDQAGWIPIDPGPPSLDPMGTRPDLELQALLGELVRKKRSPPPIRMGPEDWRWLSWRQVAAILSLTLLGLVLAGYSVKGYRRLAPRLFRLDPTARLAYRATLDRLAEAGWTRKDGETREAFAARVAPLAPDFPQLTRLHLRACFGGRSASKREASALRRGIRHQLAQSGGWWRRLAGLMAPWRWWRSR